MSTVVARMCVHSLLKPSVQVQCTVGTLVNVVAPWRSLSAVLSAVLWFLFLLAFGAFPIRLSTDLHYSFQTVAKYPQFWLQIFMVPIACLVPVFFFRAMKR